jgi:peptidoglycan hydrolase CwlO-like protein
MAEESDPDVEKRLSVLHKQREELDEKIAHVRRGEVDVLSDFELRDRFQQITQLAHGLLAGFREVEDNFRKLSRSARERIALWDGSKGNLLDELWKSRDEISNSDQGRSFGAFCDFLLSVASREELSSLMSTALKLPAVREQARDARLERMHYDWIAAGESKIAALEAFKATLETQMQQMADALAELERKRKTVGAKKETIASLSGFRSFDELAWRTCEQAIARLQEEKQRLESASDKLAELRGQLLDAEKMLAATEDSLTKLQGEMAKVEVRIESAEILKKQTEALLVPAEEDVRVRIDEVHGSLASDAVLTVCSASTTAASRRQIVQQYPRTPHFKEDILQAFYDGIKHKPETTFGNVKADVLADKDPAFRRSNFCSVIRNSSWQG